MSSKASSEPPPHSRAHHNNGTTPFLKQRAPGWVRLLAVGVVLSSGCDLSTGGNEDVSPKQSPEEFETARVARFEFAKSKFLRDMREQMTCESPSLTYLMSEQGDGWTYDIYTASGCGQQSNVQMKTKGELRTGIQYSFQLVPSEEDLKAASEPAVLEHAKRMLDCDTAVSVTKSGKLDPGQAGYTTKVVAKGCDNRVEFAVRCWGRRYDGGRHELGCALEG